MRFQIGFNKVAIELSGVQFRSEITLVILNRTRAARSFDFEITRMISDQIALHLVQLPLYNAASREGKMPTSQRRTTITLIPKQDSNLRPITLLNLDYKIASNLIAKRLERVLKRSINPDQTGFIKGKISG